MLWVGSPTAGLMIPLRSPIGITRPCWVRLVSQKHSRSEPAQQPVKARTFQIQFLRAPSAYSRLKRGGTGPIKQFRIRNVPKWAFPVGLEVRKGGGRPQACATYKMHEAFQQIRKALPAMGQTSPGILPPWLRFNFRLPSHPTRPDSAVLLSGGTLPHFTASTREAIADWLVLGIILHVISLEVPFSNPVRHGTG